MQPKWNVWRSERGAIFVQVGVAVFVLMALNVFVVDYGMMWVARGQAQNAADAGALAGATSRAYDDFGSPPAAGGHADDSARLLATVAANGVWQQPPVVDVSWTCPPGASGQCVQVDVYRDAAHSNGVETLFGPILGVTRQDVRATATAIVRYGNAVPCLRPLAFADEWTENTVSPATTYPNHRFERYDATGTPLPSNADVYVPASDSVSGSTTIPTDAGERIEYEPKLDLPPLTSPITRQLPLAVELPTWTAPNPVYAYTTTCTPDIIRIGDTLRLATPPAAGQIAAALDYLYRQDTRATWNESLNRIELSCAPGTCAPRWPISPRLVPVPLYDPDKFQKGRSTTGPGNWLAVGCPTDNPCITVTNIVGFFIHDPVASVPTRHGHFLRFPGLIDDAAPRLTPAASWLVSPQLVR
jgi:Putative Flp pilus-assembly TadE/G-like